MAELGTGWEEYLATHIERVHRQRRWKEYDPRFPESVLTHRLKLLLLIACAIAVERAGNGLHYNTDEQEYSINDYHLLLSALVRHFMHKDIPYRDKLRYGKENFRLMTEKFIEEEMAPLPDTVKAEFQDALSIRYQETSFERALMNGVRAFCKLIYTIREYESGSKAFRPAMFQCWDLLRLQTLEGLPPGAREYKLTVEESAARPPLTGPFHSLEVMAGCLLDAEEGLAVHANRLLGEWRWGNMQTIHPDNVLAHTIKQALFAASAIALERADEKGNKEADFYRILLCCLVHDLAEGLISDIPGSIKWMSEVRQVCEKVEGERFDECISFFPKEAREEFRRAYDLQKEYDVKDDKGTFEGRFFHGIEKMFYAIYAMREYDAGNKGFLFKLYQESKRVPRIINGIISLEELWRPYQNRLSELTDDGKFKQFKKADRFQT